MPEERARHQEILDNMVACFSSTGEPPQFLEAAHDLLTIQVPEALPPDPRLPSQYNAIPPRDRFTRILYEAGVMLVGMNRYAEAVPFLSRVLALAPGHADAHREISIALMGSGRAEDALPHCEALTGLRPDLLDGYLLSGDCQLKLMNYGMGKKCYEIAHKMAPDDPRVIRRITLLQGLAPRTAYTPQRPDFDWEVARKRLEASGIQLAGWDLVVNLQKSGSAAAKPHKVAQVVPEGDKYVLLPLTLPYFYGDDWRSKPKLIECHSLEEVVQLLELVLASRMREGILTVSS